MDLKGSQVTRKQTALVGVTLLIACVLSAAIAYRLGLRRSRWSPSASPSAGVAESGQCVDFRDAASQVGKNGCVSGRLLRLFTSRAGNTFLDFCPDYKQCPFTSVIFASDRAKFGDLGILAGRQVEIRGAITMYQGRAEIIIHDPQQIRPQP